MEPGGEKRDLQFRGSGAFHGPFYARIIIPVATYPFIESNSGGNGTVKATWPVVIDRERRKII